MLNMDASFAKMDKLEAIAPTNDMNVLSSVQSQVQLDRMERLYKKIIRQSTPEGFKQYFISKANGDKKLAEELDAKLLEDIRNDPGFGHRYGGCVPSVTAHGACATGGGGNAKHATDDTTLSS